MTSCTDPLALNEKKLFKDLKSSLPKLVTDTTDILEIREGCVYVWHAEKCAVLTLNLNAVRAKHEDVPYQRGGEPRRSPPGVPPPWRPPAILTTFDASVDLHDLQQANAGGVVQSLQPTDPPIFEVTHLLINETVSQLVLWGTLGIVVVELPKRWGKDAQFQGGKRVISCLSHNLDGCYSQLSTSEVRKVRWHPGSTTDSHLLVLTADNIFQLYECEVGETPKMIRTWKVGPSSHSPSKIPNLVALGDTAVDFDFVSPAVKHDGEKEIDVDKVSWKDIEWPILVLRGSGDVLLVRGNVLMNHNKPVVFGSLSIFPPTVDNYGTDSCSIMCLQTTPPIVVIASCSGKIYHAILLNENNEDDEKRTWSQYGSTYSLHTPDEALYVYECVEMELGLFYSDNDKKYTCPIHLQSDRENKSRYFCSHNAGIHVVNVPMASQLDDYVAADQAGIDLHIPNLIKNASAQYLVSTRTKYTGREEATPVLGFGLLQEPCILIAVLHTGVVIDISVVDLHYIPKIETTAPVTSPSKKVIKESFDSHVKQLLKKETSQPITMLGLRQNLSTRECLELLYRATTVFRKQHFIRHDKVREEFGKKARTLKALKTHQLNELENLTEMKKNLHLKAEHLAERYEDIKDKQEELAGRAEEVLRLVHLKEPNMNPIERAEGEEIRKMSDKVKELSVRLEQLKKKKSYNQTLMNDAEKDVGRAEVVLKQSQIDSITKNLTQMGKEVAELIAREKTLRENVGT